MTTKQNVPDYRLIAGGRVQLAIAAGALQWLA